MITLDEMQYMEDIQLLKLSQANHACFEILVRRYRQKLFMKALSVLGDNGEAEDAVQIAFLNIWRHASSYKPRIHATFENFAYRVVTNAAINIYRKRKRMHARETSISFEDEAYLNVRDARGDSNKEKYVHLLKECVGQLPAELQSIMRQRLEGYSNKEIVCTEGISAAALKKRFFHAQAELREIVRQRLKEKTPNAIGSATSVDDIGLSSRIVTILRKRRGIVTIEDLCKHTYERLLMTPGMEAHLVDQICEKLKRLGLSLCT